MRENMGTIMLAVIIPIVQAGVSGFLVFLILWVFLALNGIPNPPGNALLFGLITSAISWFLFRHRWVQQFEKLLKLDLDGDGVIGVPYEVNHGSLPELSDSWETPAAPSSPSNAITIREEVDTGQDWYSLPIAREKVEAVALGVARGLPLTHASFAGAGKIMTRAEYENFITALVFRGFLTRDPYTKGVRLTGKGRALFRALTPQEKLPGE